MAITIDSEPTGALLRSEDPSIIRFHTDKYSGGAPSETNLSAQITVVVNSETIVFNARYDATGTSYINIGSLVDIAHYLPSMSLASFTGTLQELHSDAVSVVSVSIDDVYGEVPTPEGSPATAGAYHFVIGVSSRFGSSHVQGFNYILLSHSRGIVRPAHPDMVDWRYIFIEQSIPLSVRVDLFKSDGAIVVENIDPIPALDVNKIYSIQTGPRQILSRLTDTVDLVGYSVIIDNIAIAEYDLSDPYHPFNTYLTAFNGVGGYETLYLKGKRSHQIKAQRKIVQNYIDGVPGLSIGDFDQTVPSVEHYFKCPTGYQPESYIVLLRSIISNPIWIQSHPAEDHIKLIGQSTTANYYAHDEDLPAFDLSALIAITQPYATQDIEL